jgi:predicted acylesterase/phospholipase RssA
MRFSVGAVDVQSGNFTYFDNRRERIGPEHVMASGALPPGFGAVPIGEHFYWDGGLVSNTPLAYVMEQLPAGAARPVTVFQIDLFRARGRVPQTLADAAEREKDIRFQPHPAGQRRGARAPSAAPRLRRWRRCCQGPARQRRGAGACWRARWTRPSPWCT